MHTLVLFDRCEYTAIITKAYNDLIRLLVIFKLYQFNQYIHWFYLIAGDIQAIAIEPMHTLVLFDRYCEMSNCNLFNAYTGFI